MASAQHTTIFLFVSDWTIWYVASSCEWLQFVCDLGLWTSLGAERNLGRAPMRTVTQNLSFLPMCWKRMHFGLIDLVRQLGLPKLFRTSALHDWFVSYPFTHLTRWKNIGSPNSLCNSRDVGSDPSTVADHSRFSIGHDERRPSQVEEQFITFFGRPDQRFSQFGIARQIKKNTYTRIPWVRLCALTRAWLFRLSVQCPKFPGETFECKLAKCGETF